MNHQIHGLIQQAVQYFQSGNLAGAANLLSRVLQIQPKNFDALHILGVVKGLQNDPKEAKRLLQLAVKIDGKNNFAHFNLAKALSDLGEDSQALAHHGAATTLDPKHIEGWLNYGKSLAKLKRYDDAIECFDKAIDIKKDYLEAILNKGISLHALKKYEEAIVIYDRALQIDPEYHDAMLNKGTSLKEIEQYDLALEYFDRLITAKPDFVEALNGKASILIESKQCEQQAIDLYDQAITIKPDYAEAIFNKGNALSKQEKYADAINCFRQATLIKHDYSDAYANLGTALLRDRKYSQAVQSYQQAINFSPENPVAHFNYGCALMEVRELERAMAAYDAALNLKPEYTDALLNSAVTLMELKRFEEALHKLTLAKDMGADEEAYLSNYIFLKRRMCSWDGLGEELIRLLDGVRSKDILIQPFIAHALTDDLEILRSSAKKWAEKKIIHYDNKIESTEKVNKKIKIGYFSADFRIHPVSFLTAELFELHDRNKFEIYAFSIGPNTQDYMRKRLEKSFDQFIDVRDQPEKEIVRIARDIGIDIAIDLGGYTQDSRVNIFSERVAPVQASYLGFLGTMGVRFIDYIIADSLIIPAEFQSYYDEKIAYIPSYQVNDNKKIETKKVYSKEMFGIDSKAFVYCCFNNNYKITPEIFSSWMRILSKTENTILFIYVDTDLVLKNLRLEAEKLGISGERIIPADYLPNADFIERCKVADLFLDTFPYNAGTTASDALWAGLPILTMQGKSFSSRMASSILSSIGLPEMITQSSIEYEDLAIKLASDKDLYMRIKKNLLDSRNSCALFDTKKFTSDLEAVYEEMHKRSSSQLPLDNINLQTKS